MNEAGFYHERGLPYKRGYLLYGVPGAGKSSLSEFNTPDLNGAESQFLPSRLSSSSRST
jgi:ATP-dependent 26S proteasome regulatory subunit